MEHTFVYVVDGVKYRARWKKVPFTISINGGEPKVFYTEVADPFELLNQA